MRHIEVIMLLAICGAAMVLGLFKNDPEFTQLASCVFFISLLFAMFS